MAKRKAKKDDQTLPLFLPDTEWRPPEGPPNLNGTKLLAVDTETNDPRLLDMGPGFLRGDAYPVGFSIATEDAQWYFPSDHEGGDNCDWDVWGWAKDQLSDDRSDKVFANASYDLESFERKGIRIGGKIHDIQIAQPLINETTPGGFSLNNLAKIYLDDEKDESLLEEAAAAFHVDPKGEMWRLPARFVGAYGEHDAALPIKIFKKQVEIMRRDNLMQVYDLECRVLRVVQEMRRRGVSVDVGKAEQYYHQWTGEWQGLIKGCQDQIPFKIDPWSSNSLAQLCSHLGISYPTTDKGNPSFENSWLTNPDLSDILNDIGKSRKLEKMSRDFLLGMIMKYNIQGRLHAQFHQIRRDDKGTVSGRFSCTNPNLQQVPGRDPYFGPIIRGLFLPEQGEQFTKFDFSSQEPRLLIHLAHLLVEAGIFTSKNLKQFIRAFRENPATDLHQMTADMMNMSNMRRESKDINLGLSYGMGIPKLAAILGLSVEDAQPFFDMYFRELDFIPATAQHAMKTAQEFGYISTIVGRRRHFNDFEPNIYTGQAQRKHTHKALNAYCQGSGADMTKEAMCQIYEGEGWVPLLTVHDELDYSTDGPKMVQTIRDYMENAIPMIVPNLVEPSSGANWGECK